MDQCADGKLVCWNEGTCLQSKTDAGIDFRCVCPAKFTGKECKEPLESRSL